MHLLDYLLFSCSWMGNYIRILCYVALCCYQLEHIYLGCLCEFYVSSRPCLWPCFRLLILNCATYFSYTNLWKLQYSVFVLIVLKPFSSEDFLQSFRLLFSWFLVWLVGVASFVNNICENLHPRWIGLEISGTNSANEISFDNCSSFWERDGRPPKPSS